MPEIDHANPTWWFFKQIVFCPEVFIMLASVIAVGLVSLVYGDAYYRNVYKRKRK